KYSWFEEGLLSGEVKMFYEGGSLRSIFTYEKNQLMGPVEIFYEDGKKREEAKFAHGKPVGVYTYYHANGSKAAIVPYSEEGEVQGIIMEWHENGILKSKKNMVNNQLHGNGKTAALMVYDDEQNLIESLDFKEGKPEGMHVKYFPNGKESYRVFYKDGKK